jgi:hypothetical protein
MTELPSPPNRHRRRLVIAGVLLLVVSFLTWWQWPRGDSRLVGQWTIVFPKWNTLNGETSPTREMVMTFRRNGTGTLGWPDSRNKDYFRWSYDGKTLSLGSTSPSVYGSKTLDVFNKAYWKLTGNRWNLVPWSLVVESEGQDSITFDQAKSKTPWTIDFRPIRPSRMSRIPE